jgi:choline-phosphate cytidylyltransferase
MTHAERCEAVRHCRWADEVLADAPWVVDQAWLDKYQIDYIAHDEDIYPSKDHGDVYEFAKKSGRLYLYLLVEWEECHSHEHLSHFQMIIQFIILTRTGRFVPTRRTPAISTSDLLERIVRGYRDGFFDSKLEKNGHPELLAADVDWDSSGSVERREKRIAATRSKRNK